MLGFSFGIHIYKWVHPFESVLINLLKTSLCSCSKQMVNHYNTRGAWLRDVEQGTRALQFLRY